MMILFLFMNMYMNIFQLNKQPKLHHHKYDILIEIVINLLLFFIVLKKIKGLMVIIIIN